MNRNDLRNTTLLTAATLSLAFVAGTFASTDTGLADDGSASVAPTCSGDINGDGKVGFGDLLDVFSKWDERANSFDLMLAVINNYGHECDAKD